MNNVTRFKEAFKVALAFALVYGIALNASWMNPSWAGFGVAMIAMQTAGQSIHKGLDRLAGTVPGCIAALVILALAPQERWLFMLYSALWVFFTTYMMIRSKNHPYFWNVAGFVCLVILMTGPTSAESDFQHAVFRTLETALGISVYTLITVFIWPVNNAGAIRNCVEKLTSTFEDRNRATWNLISGQSQNENTGHLHQQSVQQLVQWSQALLAQGSESYEVHELRPALEQAHRLATSLMESQDRLETSLEEVTRIDVKTVFPDLQDFFLAQNRRLDQIRLYLQDHRPEKRSGSVALTVDKNALGRLSSLDIAAALIFRDELKTLDMLTTEMFDCIRELRESETPAPASTTPAWQSDPPHPWLPIIDRDHFIGALFPPICLIAGFLVWIFINPPGHSAWLELPAIVAMAVGTTQQTRASAFFKPFAFMLTLALAVYVFVLPQLSSFAGLGMTLFLCAFVARYFFTGLAQLAGMVAIINMITIQNQQTYNFAAQANALVFTLLGFLFVYAMSYLIGSPRPEKVVIRLTRRFFHSAQFLISQSRLDPDRKTTWSGRWKIAYYRNELDALPGKITAWCRTIDHRLFPGTSPEQMGQFTTSLQSLVYRIDELLASPRQIRLASSDSRELMNLLQEWLQVMESIFENWSIQAGVLNEGPQTQAIAARLSALREKTRSFLSRIDDGIPQQAAEEFFRLLGAVRGIAEALNGYVRAADGIDWSEWREERFS